MNLLVPPQHVFMCQLEQDLNVLVCLSSECCYCKNDVVLHAENKLLFVVTYPNLVVARDFLIVHQIYLNPVDVPDCRFVATSETEWDGT